MDYIGWILLSTAAVLWVVGFFYQMFTQEGYQDD